MILFGLGFNMKDWIQYILVFIMDNATESANMDGDNQFLLGLNFEEFLALVIGGSVLVIGSIIAVVICCYCCYRHHNTDERIELDAFDRFATRRRSVDNNYQRQRSRNETNLDVVVHTFGEEPPSSLHDAKKKINFTNILENTVIKRTMIDGKRLKLGKLIGEGKFGNVFEGKLARKRQGSMTVAVKTINVAQCSEKEIQEFLDETLCMRGFHHRNVLSVIGLCIRDDRPYVVLPFMQNGDLKSYISNKTRVFTVKDLLGYAAQVAEGMAYLEEQSFIHRDLAARNCVVSDERVVKVADFGLSRDIFVDEYYRIANLDLPLPVRWMSLEALTKQVFTHKSDVWSFGVLIWELLTRGRVPYAGMDNVAVIVAIRNGKRLERPPYIADQMIINNEDAWKTKLGFFVYKFVTMESAVLGSKSDDYSILEMCWKDKPEARPNFEELTRRLKFMIANPNL